MLKRNKSLAYAENYLNSAWPLQKKFQIIRNLSEKNISLPILGIHINEFEVYVLKELLFTIQHYGPLYQTIVSTPALKNTNGGDKITRTRRSITHYILCITYTCFTLGILQFYSDILNK